MDQKRYFDVKADVLPGLQKLVDHEDRIVATLQPTEALAAIMGENGTGYSVLKSDLSRDELRQRFQSGDLR
ncbi:MAG: hypothetical protein P8X75_13990, partial [Limibacillus sp.]